MALDEGYRDYFIRNLHDALSGHTSSSVEEAVKLVEINPTYFPFVIPKYSAHIYILCTCILIHSVYSVYRQMF